MIAPAATADVFDRPIFIIAPPRSGSTFLFEGLRRADAVVHLEREADFIWWRHFPYDRLREPSDYVGADGTEAATAFCRDLYREAVSQTWRRGERADAMMRFAGRGRIRYIDKTIANCFHLDLLARLFPDALYVHLVREPRANIASMIEGWPHARLFGKPMLERYVRELPGARIEHWSYPAPPGWTAVADRPLAEICAWSWQQHVDVALDRLKANGMQAMRIRYEDVVAEPVEALKSLVDDLDLAWTPALAEYAATAPLSPTTVTSPMRDKWRRTLGPIGELVPGLKETAARIGYRLAEPAETKAFASANGATID